MYLAQALAVHADQERLVAERRHVLAKMFGNEGRDLLDPIVGGEEGAQSHGAVEDLVELVDVGDAIGLGQREELLVQPLRRHRHVARRHGVADRQRRLVLDRFGDGVLVEIAPLVFGAEDLEGPLALGRAVDRRSGEADNGRVGHRRHQIGARARGPPSRCASSMKDMDVVAGAGVLLDPSNLWIMDRIQPAPFASQQVPELLPGARAPDRNVPAAASRPSSLSTQPLS